MSMMTTTGGDIEKYKSEIKSKFAQVKILREKLEIAKKSTEINEGINQEYNKILSMFKNFDLSFEEYDDVIIRRLVECVRVMKDRKIIVVLKGGLMAEEYF